jgi:RNA polymerase sigma-70 factor (ECF subfamily)
MNGAQEVSFENTYALEKANSRDDETLADALTGSHTAFASLYGVYSRRLYRTIIAITKDTQDAEDALQETFLRAHLALHTFEGRSNVYSWLTRIAINSALMTLRRRRVRPEILFDPQPDPRSEPVFVELKDPAPNPEEAYEFRQRRIFLYRAIRKLSPYLKRPLQMQMRSESSINEISKALGISVAATKTRLHRARLALSVTRCGFDCWRPNSSNAQKRSAPSRKDVNYDPAD